MTVQQLKYFLDAAKSLNFTKTGEAFFISQSAVTQQIHNLEQELGVKLFVRRSRRLALTDAGRVFMGEAQGILARTEDAVERVRAVQNGKSGTLDVGYLKGIEMSRFPKSVQSFHEKYPGVHLNLSRDNAVALHDKFMGGKYDIIFQVRHDMLSYPGAQCRPLGSYGYYVALPPKHPLAAREQVRQSDLREQPLILHDFQRGVPGSAQLPRPYLPAELMGNIISTEDDIETILLMVAAGAGVAIVPEFDIWQPQINLNLIYRPLDTGGCQASLCLYYAEGGGNPLIPLFLEEV